MWRFFGIKRIYIICVGLSEQVQTVGDKIKSEREAMNNLVDN